MTSKTTELDLIHYLLAPLAAALTLFALAYGAGFDFTLASALYQLQGNGWLLQHHWLTEQLLHRHVRTLNEVLVLSLLGYWLWLRFVLKDQSQKQQALGLLLLSLLLCFIAVALLKRLLPMECPWDLQQFGGHSAFWGLFTTRPTDLPATQCFPAGHASIGFAWLALFYYWRELKPKQAWLGLTIAGSAGAVLGFVQQLRGAHFLSHDIATAALCWLIATLLYMGYKAKPEPATHRQNTAAAYSFDATESSDV